MATESTYIYGILPEQAQEDALHATRLLNVEERPLQRVTKALLSRTSLLRSLPKQPVPEDPPENYEPLPVWTDPLKRQRFREEVLLEFAALENSILRIQLIQSSNQRERERYAAEKAKILETAQAVRSNTVELRAQLEEAQQVLKLRKGYDDLAVKILDDKKLKSREESREEIERLEKEIEDLAQEGAEYEGTWVGRREQFDRVVAEGEAMVRLIRGIKEDVEGEKDEGMEEAEEAKGESSRVGTPGPGERTPMRVPGGETPRPESSGEAGGGTPARPSNRFLEVEDASRLASGAASPLRHEADVEMEEPTIEPPPKASTGMEATAAQVADSTNDAVVETMDET